MRSKTGSGAQYPTVVPRYRALQHGTMDSVKMRMFFHMVEGPFHMQELQIEHGGKRHPF